VRKEMRKKMRVYSKQKAVKYHRVWKRRSLLLENRSE
jgi:hypothetical protein